MDESSDLQSCDTHTSMINATAHLIGYCYVDFTKISTTIYYLMCLRKVFDIDLLIPVACFLLCSVNCTSFLALLSFRSDEYCTNSLKCDYI